MPALLSRVNAALQGLLLGLNGAYLGCVLLGLLLPSWPFNALFTPLALFALLLQWPQYHLLVVQRRRLYVRWARLSALVLVGLWLYYFSG